MLEDTSASITRGFGTYFNSAKDDVYIPLIL